MRKLRDFSLRIITAIGAALHLAASPSGALAADKPRIEIWRLDCGSIEVGQLDDYSDSFLYPGRRMTFTDSCYLVRNGSRYLLWDTGLPKDLLGKAQQDGADRMSLARSVADQLAQLRVRSEQITFVGISHYHYDHTGQAAEFPGATLLVDRRDWDVVKGREDLSSKLTPWIGGSSKVEILNYDHDVFGDGSVTMLRTPGHTPGHRSLLVKLEGRSPILLSGDAVHFRENWSRKGVPGFNTSRAETVASMARLQTIADQLGATLVIQHEPEDVAKLAKFPAPTN